MHVDRVDRRGPVGHRGRPANSTQERSVAVAGSGRQKRASTNCDGLRSLSRSRGAALPQHHQRAVLPERRIAEVVVAVHVLLRAWASAGSASTRAIRNSGSARGATAVRVPLDKCRQRDEAGGAYAASPPSSCPSVVRCHRWRCPAMMVRPVLAEQPSHRLRRHAPAARAPRGFQLQASQLHGVQYSQPSRGVAHRSLACGTD